MSLTLMTKLDAVNKCLEAVWEDPVSAIDIPGIATVAMAKRVLDDANRTIQGKGWSFNTDDDFVISPDNNGLIPLPANTLEVKTCERDALKKVAYRGGKLYDRDNKTFTFTQPLHLRLITLMDFEDLPSAAREYIAIYAARVFKDKWLQVQTPSQMSTEEATALAALEESEGQTEHSNMFTDSWSVGLTLERM